VCYLFEATKPFFNTWVKFTVSTLFMLAVLTVIVTIAMKAILIVTATLAAADMASGGNLVLRDIATTQGGLGMLMTTLLLGGPPLVTNFFSGAVVATFSAFNPVSQSAGGKAAGSQEDMMTTRVNGSSPGPNTQKNEAAPHETENNYRNTTKQYSPQGEAVPSDNGGKGLRGNANPKTKGK